MANEPVIDGGQVKGSETHSADATPGSTNDWRQAIPVELRSEKSLETIKDIPTLVKNYVESQKYIGAAIKLPGEKATPEEVKAFQKKLGVPEKVEEYGVKRPILPEYAGWTDELHGQIINAAHAAGLTKSQASKLVDGLSQVVLSQAVDPVKLLEENKAALQAEWGDNFERNLILSSRGAEHLGGQELLEALQRTGAGMDPVVVKAFHKLGAGLLEQGLIKNEETKLETIQDAEAKIKSIKADAKHPYWDASHPNHADAVNEYRRLLQLIEANK